MLNAKGQAGGVFKILIGAVIGITIIGIVYSIITIMSNQKEYLSEEVFSNKVKMAMKNPTGQEYIVNDYTFAQGKVLSKKSLSQQTGLAEGCISLNNDPNKNIISFPKEEVIDLGVLCNLNEHDCQVMCYLNVYDRGYSEKIR
jgi:hypothetical protein